MSFTLPNIGEIQGKDRNLGEALLKLQAAIQNISSQGNLNPEGNVPPPSQVSSINVSASQGIFDIQIQDNSPAQQGLEYFIEYSLTATFNQPTVISLGPSRNWRGMLGNQTLYFRAYSQYPTSNPSNPVYLGGATSPTPIVGGGTSTGPVPQASAGSGTAPTNGLTGGVGYGKGPRTRFGERNTQ